MPALQQSLLSFGLGLEGESLDGWVAFWLTMHDLGKFSEAFQSQRADVFLQLRGRCSCNCAAGRPRNGTRFVTTAWACCSGKACWQIA